MSTGRDIQLSVGFGILSILGTAAKVVKVTVNGLTLLKSVSDGFLLFMRRFSSGSVEPGFLSCASRQSQAI